MNREVENFLASHSFARETKDRYRRFLRELVLLDVAHLDAAALLSFVERPAWGSSQRYIALAACRKYIRWLHGDSHPALAARVKRLPTSPQPRLSADQIKALLESFDRSTPMGKRDSALAVTALDCNLRASELCAVEVGNVYLRECKLYALVKGGQWAWKTFSPETSEFIDDWLSVRAPALGVHSLFVSFQSQNAGRPLTREGLQIIMRRWGRRVGFHISPHMFRRSYAMIMTLNGAPKKVVQDGGGWRSSDMVDHYIGDLKVEPTRSYLPVKGLYRD